jgi:hypothetical protein
LRAIRLTRFVSRYVSHCSFDGLCFGAPAHHHEERERRGVYHFHPSQVFGVLWWRRYPHDRQHRALAIVQALGADEAGHELPGIHGHVAVHGIVDQYGPAGQDGSVDLLLDLIHDLKLRGREVETLPPSFWTEAVHHILLLHARSHSTASEEVACAI